MGYVVSIISVLFLHLDDDRYGRHLMKSGQFLDVQHLKTDQRMMLMNHDDQVLKYRKITLDIYG